MSIDLYKDVLLEHVPAQFRLWITTGELRLSPYEEPHVPLTCFAQFVSLACELFEGKLDLHRITVSQLLAMTIPDQDKLAAHGGALYIGQHTVQLGPYQTFEQLALDVVCDRMLPRLIGSAIDSGAGSKEEEDSIWLTMVGRNEQALARELTNWANSPEIRQALAVKCFQILAEVWGSRPLWDTFLVQRTAGFYRWNPDLEGHGMDQETIRATLGELPFRLRLGEYTDGHRHSVRAFEYAGHIEGGSDGAAPVAVALGMVYQAPRTASGKLRIRAEAAWDQVHDASDIECDEDVNQVQAFLAQTEGALDIIEKGDIAFLWIWERRGDAPAGAGTVCLRATLQHLRKRFPHLGYVAVDAKAQQFRARDWNVSLLPAPQEVEVATGLAAFKAWDNAKSVMIEVGLDGSDYVNWQGNDPMFVPANGPRALQHSLK